MSKRLGKRVGTQYNEPYRLGADPAQSVVLPAANESRRCQIDGSNEMSRGRGKPDTTSRYRVKRRIPAVVRQRSGVVVKDWWWQSTKIDARRSTRASKVLQGKSMSANATTRAQIMQDIDDPVLFTHEPRTEGSTRDSGSRSSRMTSLRTCRNKPPSYPWVKSA